MSIAPALDAFRHEIRAWLEAHAPSGEAFAMEDDYRPWGGRAARWRAEWKAWLDAAIARGFTAPDWPKAYGGAGLSDDEDRVLRDELRARDLSMPLMGFGLWMIGPTLLEYGTEAQKRRYLPSIVRGEIRWCQGYSEPEAGSDLANVQTKAEDKGDHWLVNGQKIWTSYADKSDWMFAITRTDPTRKHEGITFLLIDMASPGIETRPIKLIAGESPFCEVFFRDVRVPKDQVVGAVGQGWSVAKRLLQHERTKISASVLTGAGVATSPLTKAAYDAMAHTSDASLRDRFAAMRMQGHAFSLMLQRTGESARSGEGTDAARLGLIAKLVGSEYDVCRYSLLMEAIGTSGLGWEGASFSDAAIAAGRRWLGAPAETIGGGSSEIQRNIIAKRLLGLPTS